MAGSDQTSSEPLEVLGFKRYFVLPGVILSALEVVAIIIPLITWFRPIVADTTIALRIAIPVLLFAQLVWWIVIGLWISPVYKMVQQKRRQQARNDKVTVAAYKTLLRLPVRAVYLRTFLWAVVASTIALAQRAATFWQPSQVLEFVAITVIHAYAISLVRSVWYGSIVTRLRSQLFGSVPPIERFADSYAPSCTQLVIVTCGVTAAGISGFVFYFLPISFEQYVQLQVLFPATIAAATLLQWGATKWLRHDFSVYLEYEGASDPAILKKRDDQSAHVYRKAQMLPYYSALTHLGVWLVSGIVLAAVARNELRIESDDSVLLLAIVFVIALGSALYLVLWQRELLRPFVDYITVKRRVSAAVLRTKLSLKRKLLVLFGGMVLFSVALAFLWGFVQYKNLVTRFTSRQTSLGLAWLRSEVASAVKASQTAPTPRLVQQVLDEVIARSPEPSAIYYYLPKEPKSRVLALSHSSAGTPALPWYVAAQLKLDGDAEIAWESHSLAGRRGRIVVNWNGRVLDLGSLAVFYPNYRGHDESLERPIRDLLLFFLVLFTACAGIVVLTVAQFVKPIHRLETRAEELARGELGEPVSSGGEGDEIGRLTFALEEMRRALRERIRSTEEVNVDLERAVQRRTADLAKKNRELAETLDKLTRAQDQLVRSEKMASIGQLVAGIAHEINNPVNAIVNSVNPLGETIDRLGEEADSRSGLDEAIADMRDMLRVVERGAHRTKAIVQALHNYSRTDDERVVDVDINRSLDDSLELLRHIFKKNIDVVRNFGDVGKIRGHAGQIGQVFMNLLTNAAQAVAKQDDAKVVIKTESTKDGVAIEVADNGSGIPPEILPRIFDPFFTTKDVGEGSGLGLSIVHGIVERHGGTIEVESTANVGTTFRVALPKESVVTRTKAKK